MKPRRKIKIRRLWKDSNVYFVDGLWLLRLGKGEVEYFTHDAGWISILLTENNCEMNNRMLVRAAKILRIDEDNS